MKIAIMTQPLGKNYGGIMQAWALQQVLKKMGHEPVTIDRQIEKRSLAYNVARFLYRVGKKIAGKRKAPINLEKHLPTIMQNTRNFVNQNIVISEPIYTTKQLKKHFDRECYDAVIVGSDQTWRPKYSPNIYNYFLDFLEDKEILRIAYASSFGVDEWEFSEEQTRRCAELAKKFDFISVREKSGVNLCNDFLGVEAVHVLDPTLLLEKESYHLVTNEKENFESGKGIYSYILDSTPEKTKIKTMLSEKISSDIYTYQADGDIYNWSYKKIDKYIMPPVEKWISGFEKSTYVVTDSFHGSVFSIIFNKPFVVIKNEERGGSRFNSLAQCLKLEDGFFYNEACGLDELKFESLSDKSFSSLNELKSSSWKMLAEALGSISSPQGK